MNVYFLVIACLQLISVLAPVSPGNLPPCPSCFLLSFSSQFHLNPALLVTIWVPLIFIFSISAAKEALDDLSRAKADEKANSRVYHVYDVNGMRTKKKSQDLKVGDIMWIKVQVCFFLKFVFQFPRITSNKGKRRNSMRPFYPENFGP
jgi:phospholipid-translocating ATPase